MKHIKKYENTFQHKFKEGSYVIINKKRFMNPPSNLARLEYNKSLRNDDDYLKPLEIKNYPIALYFENGRRVLAHEDCIIRYATEDEILHITAKKYNL